MEHIRLASTCLPVGEWCGVVLRRACLFVCPYRIVLRLVDTVLRHTYHIPSSIHLSVWTAPCSMVRLQFSKILIGSFLVSRVTAHLSAVDFSIVIAVSC